MPKPLPIQKYCSAGGVVVDREGDHVLVLVREGRPGPDGPPEVRLPKGHIEPGESRRQAALREVREEAGLGGLAVRADLGHQTVEFDWEGHHIVRDESYFAMILEAGSEPGQPEEQFERLWLTWDEALTKLTFEAEREWIRRARAAVAAR
jgi:8-oxo-dGTP pyrophosphatase MutT (NUDIX family)